MLGSLLRMTCDIVETSLAVTASVAEPFVDIATETLSSVDDFIVSPTADVVEEICDSVKDVVK